MLESLLRKDHQRQGYIPPASPQARMQEALAVPPPRSDAAKIDAARADAPGPATTSAEPRPDSRDLAAPAAAEETVCRLFVGPGIKLKGAEITDCDTLIVEGHVEAGMGSRSIQISEQGVFVGKAGVDVADIRGRFEGELTVRKLLIVRATGHVSGKIRYGKVSIEENGEITGDIAAIGGTATDNAPAAPFNASGALKPVVPK